MTELCFLCGSTSQLLYCQKNGFDFYRCESCGLVKVDPPPSKEQLNRYYSEAYNQYRFSFEVPLADPPKKKMHGLKVLERYCRPGRLLDVGCAYGHFLDNGRRHGWNAEGVEPLHDARILAQSRFRLRVYESISEAPHATYHAVTMWHVIEHLTEPSEFLREVHSRIREGGVLAIATPNIDSMSAKVTGMSWGWLSPPDHVVLYTRSTLRRLLEQSGFTILHVETGRGPARNILFLLLQGFVYRLGLFGRIKTSVWKAAYEYQSSRKPLQRVNVYLIAEKITEALTFILSPLLALLWKSGLGDEVLVVAQKKGSSS